MNVTPVAAAPAEPQKIRAAAQQFEALLIAQMLRAARETEGDAMLEAGEEHLAQTIAAQGGLGLANLIVEGLKP